jgi:hypothetical protein
MSAPDRSSGRQLVPVQVEAADQPRSMIVGAAVPVAPSFLDLHDEESQRISIGAVAKHSSPPFPAGADYLHVGISSYPPLSAPPLPRPSARRSFWAKFLFVTIIVALAFLVTTEIAIAKNLPWLDPRLYLVNAWKFLASKIHSANLPKLPKF